MKRGSRQSAVGSRQSAVGSRQQEDLMWTKTLLLGLVCLAGCSGFAVRSGRGDEPIPGPETGPVPGRVGSAGDMTGASGASRQTVCRSAPRPRGWLAVDYVEGGSTCGNGGYTAVVLQRLAPFPEGSLLLVCTGQSIPRGWQRVRGDEPVSSGQCPRNPGDTGTGPTVMQIERRA